MARPTSDRSSDVLGRAARRTLSKKRLGAQLSLSLERLTPLIWPPVGLLLLAISFSAAGGWSLLPGWLHVGLLAVVAVLVLWFVAVAVRHFQPASITDAEHRMETANPGHRPLTAVQDDLALGRADAAARDLWQAHRRRMAEQVAALRVPRPNPEMPKRDPWALRFAAVFLLFLGVAIGGQNLKGNLLAAMSPQFGSGTGEQVSLEAWITPPAYTARPPIFITAASIEPGQAVRVPTNSQLLARYHGGGEATMVLNEQITPFQRMTDRDLQLDSLINTSGQLEVQDNGRAIGSWNIEIIPDDPPAVELTEKPNPTLRGALRIAYQALDDYGLTQVSLHMKRVGTDEEAVFELPLPGRRQTKITDVVFRDLTDHRWAGLPVEMVLEVVDDAGQTGRSKPELMAMPERRFTQPAARAVVEQRRKLIEDANGNRGWIVRAIRALQINPGVYSDDFAAHLMLSVAASDLDDNPSEATYAENEALLWQTALRIEEGQLAVALDKLRDVQDRLMEALANGASEEEIQKLMDELQQAMDDYLDAMQQQAMERMENTERGQQGDQAQQIEQRALSDMVDKARELSRSGARDAAREMLSQLQNMLENMQMGTQSQSAQAEQQADQLMDELGKMMEQQQQLKDETYERQQRQQDPEARPPSQRDPFNSPRRNRFGRSPNTDTQNPSRGGQPGETTDEDLADIQERIRKRLGELMRQLGENGMAIPDELGQSEQAMRDSEGALGEGNRQGALGSQSEALDQLRRGTEAVLEDLANSNPNPGQNNEGASQAGLEGEQMDPLGRTPTESWGDTSGEVVPGEGALQRSREILDELRRRSGQRHRGAVEREYLDRLLQQF
jgi:uncharacterized protein (TIGR02302 family)